MSKRAREEDGGEGVPDSAGSDSSKPRLLPAEGICSTDTSAPVPTAAAVDATAPAVPTLPTAPNVVMEQAVADGTGGGRAGEIKSAWRCVCLLEVVSVEWIYMCPWARASQKSWSGSGFCLKDKKIITNAHVVKSAIDIRVRQHSNARRYSAKVVTYGPDVDLAVLEIDPAVADEFWRSAGGDEHVGVLADTLPALQETVRAIGFPRGGKTICITEGVVSRIDSIELTPPADSTCVIQIDAAINPGNSGGPVFNSKGQVAGVAFCKDVRTESDNIGYVIPAEVVRAFLERRDSEDGRYVLSPSVPYKWHKLENTSLRKAHNVPDGVSGVLLTSTASWAADVLREGDVLTRIDGRSVSDDGQVTLRDDELIQHRYLLRGKRVSEPTVFSVYRDGEEVECTPLVLKDLPPICARWADVDYLPEYLILGALALVPLAQPLGWYKQQCPIELQASIAQWNRRWPGEKREGKEQLVVLLNVFASELTFGYVRPWRRVTGYNGTAVTSLRHLREMWHATRLEVTAAKEKGVKAPSVLAKLQLEFDDDIVLDAADAIEAEANVLKTHAIGKASFIQGDE